MTDQQDNQPEPFGIVSAPEEIDIEQLMSEIRRNVAEKRKAGIYTDEGLPPWTGFLRPGDVPFSLDDQIRLLEAMARPPLDGDPISSHRPVYGSLIVAAKRFFRYWTRKYTDGMFLRQQQFNGEAVATIRTLRKQVDELRAEVEELRARAGVPPPPGD